MWRLCHSGPRTVLETFLAYREHAVFIHLKSAVCMHFLLRCNAIYNKRPNSLSLNI